MQVLFFTDTYYPFVSGVSQVIDSLTKALGKKGIKTVIICPSPHFTWTSTSKKDPKGRKIHEVPSMKLVRLYDNFRFPIKPPTVPHLVNDEETIFSVHSPFFGTAGSILTAKEVKKTRGIEIPIVHSLHTKIDLFSKEIVPSFLPNVYLSFMNYMMEKLMDRALVNTVSSSNVEKYAKERGFRRITVIRYPLTYKRFEAPTKRLKEVYPNLRPYEYLFALGRVSREKRIEFLIETFSDFQVPLVLGGTGPLLPELKRKYEGEDNIRFLGFISDKHVNLLNKYAAGTVSAGYADTLNLTLLEGMAQGAPPIAYHVGGQTAYIRDGENGFLFKNRKELQEKAQTLVENPEIRKNMEVKAKKTAMRYHPDSVVDDWIRLYQVALKIAEDHKLY